MRRSACSCGSCARSTAAASRIASAVAASDSTARSASTFCISGLSASSPPKRGTVRHVPRRLGDGAPHERGRAQHAVEAGHGDHLDDGRHATALFADHPGQGAAILDFAGGVRPVAQLVLQALDVEHIAGAVRQDARHHEAGHPARRLGEHEEDVVHRGRGEPLVPVQGVLTVHRRRTCLRDVGADVGAALLLGHPHPGEGAELLVGVAYARVVGPRREQGRPLLGEGIVCAQRRHRGVRHRDRAAVAGLGLRPGEESRRAPDMGVWAVALPRRGLEAVTDRPLHQPVPRRVELDLVDAVAVPVVGREFGVVPVREQSVLAGLLGPGLRAERRQVVEHDAPPWRQ